VEGEEDDDQGVGELLRGSGGEVKKRKRRRGRGGVVLDAAVGGGYLGWMAQASE
jgi:hypothetical protein